MKKQEHLQWKTLDSESAEDLIIFKARYDYVQNPRNDKKVKAVVLESNDAVNIIAITKDQKILLVQQYRFGTQRITTELPGGFVDAGEDSAIAAQRELLEETGYSSKHWKYLGGTDSNPVFMDSQVHHWLALDAVYTSPPRLDDGESIEISLHSVEDIKLLFQSGGIKHPHTISAFAHYFGF